MSQYFMSKARRLFDYNNLQGTTVTNGPGEPRVSSSGSDVQIDNIPGNLNEQFNDVNSYYRDTWTTEM